MSEYPDINNITELTEAVSRLEVLGGYSRSFTIDPATGETTPDRYVEKLGDYVSEFALRIALCRALRHAHAVDGLDGIITASSRDELTLTYADGSEATFVRALDDAQNAVRVAKQATGEE